MLILCNKKHLIQGGGWGRRAIHKSLICGRDVAILNVSPHTHVLTVSFSILMYRMLLWFSVCLIGLDVCFLLTAHVTVFLE